MIPQYYFRPKVFLTLSIVLLLTLIFAVPSVQSATSSANLKAFKASRNIAVLTSTNAMSYIRQPNVKLLVVLFSTFDKSCKTCANANRNFYALAKQHKDINFAFVNTQPWRAKELESVLFFRLSNTKPVSLIFHNTKVLRKLVGANYQKMPGYLKAARNIITSGHLPMYGNKLANGSFSAVVISDQYQAFLTKYLNNEKNYKALAVALGKRQKWTASQKVGYLSQADANNQALSQCNQRWKSKGNRGACQLYMVGDEYVYGKSGPQIKAITAAIKNKQTPLDKYVLKLKPLKNNKALAYAVNKNGSWTSSYVFNHSSVRSATKAVLASCEKRRLQKNMSSPCSLYYVNDRKL